MFTSKFELFIHAHATIYKFESLFGYVRYINILTRLRGFQDTFIFDVVFCIQVSFANCDTNEPRKINNFDPKASEPCQNIDISNVAYYQEYRYMATNRSS